MKRYRVVPVDPYQFDVEVWVGWRWFGSWEPARKWAGTIATFRTSAAAEEFINSRREDDALEERKRQSDKASKDFAIKFQSDNPPYEFPKETTNELQ